jgi:hypothetical protein
VSGCQAGLDFDEDGLRKCSEAIGKKEFEGQADITIVQLPFLAQHLTFKVWYTRRKMPLEPSVEASCLYSVLSTGKIPNISFTLM